MIDPAKLAAYADGELEAAGRAEVEVALAGDGEIAGQLAREQALRGLAGRAFAEVLDEPVPQSLVDAVLAAGADVPRRQAPSWLSAAACLVVGLVVGAQSHLFQPPLVSSAQGGLRATGALAAALDHQAAGGETPIQIGFSFRDQHGGYCRTFEMRRERLAGVACRDGRAWRAPVTATLSPEPTAAYRMAASSLPPAVLAAVDERIEGDPLSSRAEAEALAKRWRP